MRLFLAPILAISVAALFACGFGCSGGEKAGVHVTSAPDIGVHLAEREVFGFSNNADGADAGTLTAEKTVAVVGPGPLNVAISSCVAAPSGTVVASNTAYATIDVYKRTLPQADGGTTQVLLAAASTVITQSDAGSDGGATGNWGAYQPIAIPVVTSAQLAPNDVITASVAKTGAGVSLPQVKVSCFTPIQ